MKKQIIFYGPPGTGKTYQIQEKALQYLAIPQESSTIKELTIDYDTLKFLFERFYNDHPFLLNNQDYSPGKKPYRNLRCINPIMNYLVEQGRDYIIKKDLKEHFGWNGSSTYVQRIRSLTNFGLAEGGMVADSKEEFKITPNGIQLKNQYAELKEQGVNIAQTEYLEQFTIEHILNELKDTVSDTMTLWKNTIFVALRIVVENGKSIKKSTSHNLTAEEDAIFKKCLGYEKDYDSDVLNWLTAYLIELKLIDQESFKLTQDAINLLKHARIFESYTVTRDATPENLSTTTHTSDKKYNAKEYLISQRNSQNHLFDHFKQNKQIEIITFHPSFEYEDFLEGITVQTKQDGTLNYYYKVGVLKAFCYEALKNCLVNNSLAKDDEIPDWKSCIEKYMQHKYTLDWSKAGYYIFVIDELNRGDVAKIFGETITLIEDDKRIGELNELTITLPYTHELFGIPKNIIFLTTMNTSDKSIGAIDIAIRRRFDLQSLNPNFNVVKDYYDVQGGDAENSLLHKSAAAIMSLNQHLLKIPYISKGKLIGHALLMGAVNMDDEDIYDVWKYNIFPLLEEYFVGDLTNLIRFLNLPDEKLIDSYEGFKANTNSDVDQIINALVSSSNEDE